MNRTAPDAEPCIVCARYEQRAADELALAAAESSTEEMDEYDDYHSVSYTGPAWPAGTERDAAIEAKMLEIAAYDAECEAAGLCRCGRGPVLTTTNTPIQLCAECEADVIEIQAEHTAAARRTLETIG